jgi:hypothetical protein
LSSQTPALTSFRLPVLSVLTYEHVFNNGNHGAGAVGETWAIAKTKTA